MTGPLSSCLLLPSLKGRHVHGRMGSVPVLYDRCGEARPQPSYMPPLRPLSPLRQDNISIVFWGSKAVQVATGRGRMRLTGKSSAIMIGNINVARETLLDVAYDCYGFTCAELPDLLIVCFINSCLCLLVHLQPLGLQAFQCSPKCCCKACICLLQ